ncbi:MAG: glycosyltransferase family 4 protein [Spirochaetes bacterium]|nr:glycosyltransferase family 4 protein [Spirochaetota bacterium]
MRFAIEAHALSQDKITGVGNVILHYIAELQKIDRVNEYFIYAMDDLKHVEITNPNWRHEDFRYALKSIRMKTRETWLRLRSGDDAGRLRDRFNVLFFRTAKIILEILDEIVFSFKLARSLRENSIDVYIGTSTYYYPYFFLSPVKKAGILYDLVWKLYPGTMEFGNKLRMKFFTLRNMRKLDLLIAISEQTKRDARTQLNLNTKIEAIPLAADKKIFYPSDPTAVSLVNKRYGMGNRYILSVCTLEPRKNLKSLIEAYRLMQGRNDYQLVLVGMAGWIASDFFLEIESSDVSDRIVITGYVDNSELAPIYTGASLFVFPSLYEGFGLPVLEAMQCGCPVITSNTSSLPEVAGDAAIMVDPEDVEGLAEAMEKVLRNPSLRKNLSKKGLERARLFSWEKSARALLHHLASLQ